ncbi:DUF192 domain-containing protein [Rhizobium helianthi]|uniref:DUF192 domain-containing protein n=2 Tax=Rhizobium helianthi TaxID=1132695 RepID=A0ABW4M3G9_9HYPH
MANFKLGYLSAILALFLFIPLAALAQLRFDTEPLIIRTAQGEHHFHVELAIDARQREQGLMFRQSMPDTAGMLFDFEQPRVVNMWMKNTYIPLDMLFIDQEGRIEHIHEGAKPHDETVISSGGAVRFTLELNAGLVDKYGIKQGDRVFSRWIGNLD